MLPNSNRVTHQPYRARDNKGMRIPARDRPYIPGVPAKKKKKKKKKKNLAYKCLCTVM